ncbi:tectonic-1-like [Hetaerina americana]|uniref:tectonic-1-like n=1 Tax=Hetaerina americana TaxID=62018 RepID=UPI003A7F5141
MVRARLRPSMLLPSLKAFTLPWVWLFLVVSTREAPGSRTENGACMDEKCDLSTYGTVPSGTKGEAELVNVSTSSIIESTTVTTTPSAEDTSSEVVTTSDLFSTTRDTRDLSTISPNKYPPPTAPPESPFHSSVPSKRLNPFNGSHPFGDHCPCDLLVGLCDPNCCCDVLDCSNEERGAFSGCLPLPSPVPDPRLCRQFKWVANANHTLELQLAADGLLGGLLCITRDNNPGRLALSHSTPARSLKDFQDLIGTDSFRWSTSLPQRLRFVANSSYKAGDVLWTVQNMSLTPLDLVASGFNNLCQSKKLVRFLEDWKSWCVLPVPYVGVEESGPRDSSQREAALAEKCSSLGAESSFRNAGILRSPLHWLNTTSPTCPAESCVRAQQWTCWSQDFDDCVEVEDIPIAELRGDECINAVTAIRLVVDVLGVNVHSVQAYFVLRSVPLSGEVPTISRGHSVLFKWWSSEDDIGAEYDKDKIVWRRSGNPGYIVGAPVMAGWKEVVVLGGEDSGEDGVEGGGVLEAIRVTPHPEGWLTLLGPVAGTRGTCGGPRRVVRFGHAARWSCSVAVLPKDLRDTDWCLVLKRKTLSLLLGHGSMGNLSERFVAMFGDSAPERVGEWLPLEVVPHKGQEVVGNKGQVGGDCTGLHVSIHLELATALVGSVGNPQAKVVGALLRMGPTARLPPSAGMRGTPLALTLVSSVAWVDVTGPPGVAVVPLPTYHVRLPHDFFHPFLSNGAPRQAPPGRQPSIAGRTTDREAAHHQGALLTHRTIVTLCIVLCQMLSLPPSPASRQRGVKPAAVRQVNKAKFNENEGGDPVTFECNECEKGELSLLLDTGAVVSLIKGNLLRKGTNYFPEERIALKGITDGLIPTEGRVNLTLKCQGKESNVEFHIIDDSRLSLSFDGIMGRDMLGELGAVAYVEPKKVYMRGLMMEMDQRPGAEKEMRRKLTIPARCERLVKIPTPSTGEGLLTREKLREGVYLAEALTVGISGECIASIINTAEAQVDCEIPPKLL